LDVTVEIKRSIIPKLPNKDVEWAIDIKFLLLRNEISEQDMLAWTKDKVMELEKDGFTGSLAPGMQGYVAQHGKQYPNLANCTEQVVDVSFESTNVATVVMDIDMAMAIKNSMKSKRTCFKCGKEGHLAKDCTSVCISKQESIMFKNLRRMANDQGLSEVDFVDDANITIEARMKPRLLQHATNVAEICNSTCMVSSCPTHKQGKELSWEYIKKLKEEDNSYMFEDYSAGDFDIDTSGDEA
jgi:hypothetical protein